MNAEATKILAAMNAVDRATAHMKSERDNLSSDLARLREAVRVRPSKKAMVGVRDTLVAMEACDDIEAPALRLLVEMWDRIDSI